MGQRWAHVPCHSPVLVLVTPTQQASSSTPDVPHTEGFVLNCPEEEPCAPSSPVGRGSGGTGPACPLCGTGALQSSWRQLWDRGCCWHRIDCQGCSLDLSSPSLQLISVFLLHLLLLIPVFSDLPSMFYSSVPVNYVLEGRIVWNIIILGV